MSSTQEAQMVNMLIQINTTLLAVKRILEEIKNEGVKVRTQQSHA